MRYGESEFYPPGIDRSAAFGVEIAPSATNDDGYDVISWHGSMGNHVGGNIPIRKLSKARRVARFVYETLKPEIEAEEERRERKMAERHERSKIEWEERRVREEAERAERLAKVTPETPRIEQAVCPSCEHVDDPEQFHQPVYECSRCGQNGIGEDNRRCPDDNIFMARVGDFACPNCEDVLDDEPERVTGVEIDGVFIPEAELAHA